MSIRDVQEEMEARDRSRRQSSVWGWLGTILLLCVVLWFSLVVLEKFVEVVHEFGVCL